MSCPHCPHCRVPVRVALSWMHDDQTFERLRGATLDAIIADVRRIYETSHYGMLCSIILVDADDRDIRRVGTCVGSDVVIDEAGLAKWREATEADPDVMRLLAENT